jgi:murein DD-endopeptidase MepM/ murein hydrolase activator NlpD
MALFAIARNAPPSPQIRVVAEDAAGNRREAGWQTNLKERVFEEARIDLSPGFMSNKVPELSEDVGIDARDPLAAFQKINSEERARNEARVREIVAGSQPELLFEGAFVQMKNSAVTSRFAEHRSYFLGGKQVSEAIHYGFDLASLAQAPIEASNRGRVLFAGRLGIYGNCVILDHGMGLTSLYAHLSRIDVKVGDLVEKHGVLGRSGATGLAGGDHLHFAILVGGSYVDPTEWWDAKWVREKIEPAKQGGLLATAAGPAPAN